MEAHWETSRQAPMHLLAWPDAAGERNSVQALTVPGALSLLAGHSVDTEVKGLKAFPADQRPPVLPVFLSFRLMVGLGLLFIALGLYAFLNRARIEEHPRFLRLLPWMIPLPYLANTVGWTIAEVGRQPWIVYGIMRTRDAVSPIQTVQVAISLAAFILVYGLLGAADFYLLFKFARKGPESIA
jgi:cytochrome d ubiquinol oxidase subunit I